jgi:hypothetical protein
LRSQVPQVRSHGIFVTRHVGKEAGQPFDFTVELCSVPEPYEPAFFVFTG